MSELHGVGYSIDYEVLDYNEDKRKRYASELELPDPRHLLETLGPCKVDKRILAYLRSGRQFFSALGCSYCRFRCGAPEEDMGSRDLTDGVWVWPEGLVHYIEVHQLPLPEEFLATMEQNQWHVPELEHIDKLWEDGYSLEFWKDWYKRKVAQ